MKTRNVTVMAYIIGIFGMLVMSALTGTNAHSDVDFDQPVNVGQQSDSLFRSAADPNVAYYFPVALNRVGDIMKSEVDKDHLNARFTAEADPEDYAQKRALLDKAGLAKLQLHTLKPLSYQVENGTNVSERFNEVLTPLGDLSIGSSMQFSLTVDALSHLFGEADGDKLFDNLFGSSGEDDVGHIDYYFDAVAAKVPYQAKTSIAIFVGERNAQKALVPKVPVAGKMSADLMESTDSMGELASGLGGLSTGGVVLLKDSTSKCWDNIAPGQVCLREK